MQSTDTRVPPGSTRPTCQGLADRAQADDVPLSVLEAPLLEATPNDEEVSRVTELAAEALLKDVLSELEIPESEEEMLYAQGNQGIWFIGELRLLLGGTSPWGYGPGASPLN